MRTLLAAAAIAHLGCSPGEVQRAVADDVPAPTDLPGITDVVAPQDVLRTDVPSLADAGAADIVEPPPPGRVGRVAREGDATVLRTHPTVNYRFVDAAYDPARRVFLVVYGNGPVGGAFLDDEGVQVGDGFRLPDEPMVEGRWSQLPRVAAGPAGFVVTWHAEVARAVVPQVRRVLPGPVFGGPTVALGDPGANQESPVALAYNPEGEGFLAVWAQSGLKGRRVSREGAPQGAVLTLSTPGVWVEQPAVTWHPGARAYFITYMQERDGAAEVMLLRVGPEGAPLGEARSLSGPLSFAKVTDVALDARSGEVIASWYAVSGGTRGFVAQRVRGDGQPIETPRAVFAPHGSYDGYDTAWSPFTGTLFATFHGAGAEAAGAELDGDWREGAAFEVTAVAPRNGVFLPRVVAHPARPWWIVLGSPDYARVVAQRVSRAP
ncbi:MAG: hypothetical protein R3A48_13800 [Polyangiales bacterium]